MDRGTQEVLPVVDDPEHKMVIGYGGEAYPLRRYAQELEAAAAPCQDDAGIFGLATGKDAAGELTLKIHKQLCIAGLVCRQGFPDPGSIARRAPSGLAQRGCGTLQES
jgi:hypothetical protein